MSAAAQLIKQRVAFTRLSALARSYRVVSLVITDALALGLAVCISVLFKAAMHGGLEIKNYLLLSPFMAVFLLAFASAGLYSGIALTPPEELRRCTLCSSVVFVFLSVVTLTLRGAHSYVKPTLFVAIVLSAGLIPILRAAARWRLGGCPWWSYPAVIFGSATSCAIVVDTMCRNRRIGLKPIAIVLDDHDGPDDIGGIPVIASTDIALLDIRPDTYAVILTDVSRTMNSTVARWASRFSHLLAIPELSTFHSNLFVAPKALGDFIGLETRQRVLLSHNRVAKRILDLTLTLAAGIVALPFLLVAILVVRLDSPGSAFYFQRRIGKGGKDFKAWKFRTMHQNADQIFDDCLERNPELRREWQQSHKLKDDPRVTRIGAILRKTSLDEIPQLWNVFKGDMSLVGPRPIVQAEVTRYGSSYQSYMRVPCGITGLWQVSGRSKTTYAERVALDEYYVRNWSVWLDLYILFRTISTVVSAEGAY